MRGSNALALRVNTNSAARTHADAMHAVVETSKARNCTLCIVMPPDRTICKAMPIGIPTQPISAAAEARLANTARGARVLAARNSRVPWNRWKPIIPTAVVVVAHIPAIAVSNQSECGGLPCAPRDPSARRSPKLSGAVTANWTKNDVRRSCRDWNPASTRKERTPVMAYRRSFTWRPARFCGC